MNELVIIRFLSPNPFVHFFFIWCRRPHAVVLWKFCALRECGPLMISSRGELSFPHFPLRSQQRNRSTRSLISWEDMIKNMRASSSIWGLKGHLLFSCLPPKRCYLPPLPAVCIIDENKRLHNLCIVGVKIVLHSLILQQNILYISSKFWWRIF